MGPKCAQHPPNHNAVNFIVILEVFPMKIQNQMIKINLQSKMKSAVVVEHVPSSSKQVVTSCLILETLYDIFVLVIINFVYPSPHALEI